jgi:hypothetical protein
MRRVAWLIYMQNQTRRIDHPSNSLVTRVLDSVDRGHASAAGRVHGLRNRMRDSLSRGLNRIEAFATATINSARARIVRADAITADAIIRTQGRIGNALERARHARSISAHVTS